MVMENVFPGIGAGGCTAKSQVDLITDVLSTNTLMPKEENVFTEDTKWSVISQSLSSISLSPARSFEFLSKEHQRTPCWSSVWVTEWQVSHHSL
jgi:hypothetical protein